MKFLKKIKKLLPQKIKIFIRKNANIFIKGENIAKSKKKWDELASINSRYYVLTDLGEKISETEFKQTGNKDFNQLIANDLLLKNRLGNFKEKTVLEIGCGTGRITEFLAENFAKVFAIDISEEMVRIGRERLNTHRNIEFIANDGQNYPLKDNSVDLVFSFIVFQHMPNKEVIENNFREIKRVLKNDGMVKIQVRGLPTNKHNWFYGPSFNKKEIGEILTSAGLRLAKTDGEYERYFWLWVTKI